MTPALYPVGLVLSGRRCLVVGGGEVASRKVSGLLAAGAEVHVVATEVGAALRSLAGGDGGGDGREGGANLTLERRPYRQGEVAGYWLVVAATGDPSVNRAVYEDCQAARVWVNAVDAPGSCSFVLPAVARQGPVTVAVSTSGYSPALASWLKAELSRQLGPEVEVLAEMLASARAGLKAAGRHTEDVDWQPVVNWAMLDLIRSGRRAEAKERLEACLSSSSA